MVELAGLLSINYHWKQLFYGPENIEVRKALILDYIGALSAVAIILTEIVKQSIIGTRTAIYLYPLLTFAIIYSGEFPTSAFLVGILATVNLLYSWVYVNGLGYLYFHGLWHIFSSAAVYMLFTTPT